MKRAYCHLLVILLILSALPLLLPVSDTAQAATTLYVGSGQTYTTIQAAINAASPGDTVRVYAGTYNENVIVNKTLTIIGNGTSATFVKGTYTVGTGHVFCVNASYVNISQMNITLKTTLGGKAGIWLSSPFKAMKVENCNVSDCPSGISTVIAVSNADYIVIKNCTFYNDNQYGLFLWFAKYPIVQNNTFYKCQNGAYTAMCTYMKVYNNSFANCQGSGMYDQITQSMRVENNTFKNCGYPFSSGSQGGFGISSPNSEIIKNNTFVKCSIYLSGSHSANYWNTHIIQNNTVNGKPVYYAKDKNGLVVPSGQGEIILGNCKNVLIENQTFDNSSVGILLGLTDRATVRNTTLTTMSNGILASSCDWVNITNCSFNACRSGIYNSGDSSYPSNNCTFANNRMRGGTQEGIRMDAMVKSRSRNNTMSAFATSSSPTGIYVWNTARCIVENNVIEDFTYNCIYVSYRSNNNTVCNNSLKGPSSMSYSPWGIYVNYGSMSWAPTYNTFINNTLQQLRGGGFRVTYAKNTTIVKNIINSCNDGVYIDRYSEYVRVLDNNISQSTTYGIRSEGISGTYNKWIWITNNTIDKTTGIIGVRLYYTNNATVSKNRFYSLATGVMADSYANDIRVDNNSFQDCSKYSITSQGVSNLNPVRRVTAYNNTCLRSGTGIRIYLTNTSVIANNTVKKSTNWGVELNSSTYTTLTDNTLESSASYGLRSRLCANTTLHHNCFVENGGAKSQAFDQGSTGSLWDNGTEGNWWSNWTRPDANGDHIVDRAYNIDLTTVQDRYPLTSFIPHLLAPKNLTPSEDVLYLEKFIDDSGNATEWSIRTNASWLTSIIGNGFSGTPDNSNALRSYWVNGSAKGAKGQSDFQNVTIKVNNTNDAPFITNLDNPDAQKNLLYASDYNASDIDPTKDILTWTLNTNATWLSIDATTGWLNGTPSAAQLGTYWVNVTVSDGHGGLAWTNFTITVVNQINYAPVIISADDKTAVEDALYNHKYNYTDPNFDPVKWFVASNASFLSINSDGWLNGTPTNSHAAKTFWVNVSCKDPMGKSDFSNFTLAVINVNDPPVIITDNVTTATEDAIYSVDYDAMDPDPTGDVITWTLLTNAAFLTIAPATGMLSGTPQNQHVGPHWVNITAHDNHGGSDSHNFTLTVMNTNDDPQISTAFITSAYEDANYYADINATDVDVGDAFAWAMTSNASFLTIAPATGVLSGMPGNSEVGPHWVNVTVSDGNGGSDWRNYTFLVLNVNDPPVITTANTLIAYEDREYSTQYNATDVDPTNDGFSWYLYTNASFLKLGTTTGLLSGKPSALIVGRTFVVNVSVFDGRGGWGWTNFTLSVLNANDAPYITTVTLQSAKEDEQYSFDLTATDPDPTNDTLTWEMRTNASFISMDPATGRLTGLPERKDVGPHWLNVTVTDDWGASGCKNLTLAVIKRANHPVTVLQPSVDVTFKEDETYELDLTTMFMDEDGEVLRFNYVGGQGNVTASVKSAVKAVIRAPQDWSGKETLTFSCSDKSGTKYANAVATVTPVNDPPADLAAVYKNIYEQGGNQTVSASATDPDIPYGDALTFTWYANDTQKGQGEALNLSLTAGIYMITVKVADTASEQATLSFQITVLAPAAIVPNDDDDDDNVSDTDGDGLTDEWEMKYWSNLDQAADGDPDKDGKTNLEEQRAGTDPTKPPKEEEADSTNYLLWIILAVILLIVISVIIVIVLRSRKKKAEEPAAQMQAQRAAAAPPATYEAAVAEPESLLPDPMTLGSGMPEPAPVPVMEAPSPVEGLLPPMAEAGTVVEPWLAAQEPAPVEEPPPIEQAPAPVAQQEPPPSGMEGPAQKKDEPLLSQKSAQDQNQEIDDLFKL